MIINPKKAERRSWEMFFVGFFYAGLSLLLVNWIFGKDPVLSHYAGILMITFTVMFSIPFVYYTIRLEEKKISAESGTLSLLKEHRKAIMVFLWLFLGYVVAYSIGYMLLSSTESIALSPGKSDQISAAANSFKAQIETYCLINRPANYQECIRQYGLEGALTGTAFITSGERLFLIFWNNMNVLIFTLIFSLIFGAGVIFILAWNASVIAAAIGIYTQRNIAVLHLGISRYMLHGLPEIASYFIVALAGGLISVAVIKHEAGTEKFWSVLHDSLNLIIIAVAVLFIAALLEVFVTPLLF